MASRGGIGGSDGFQGGIGGLCCKQLFSNVPFFLFSIVGFVETFSVIGARINGPLSLDCSTLMWKGIVWDVGVQSTAQLRGESGKCSCRRREKQRTPLFC